MQALGWAAGVGVGGVGVFLEFGESSGSSTASLRSARPRTRRAALEANGDQRCSDHTVSQPWVPGGTGPESLICPRFWCKE